MAAWKSVLSIARILESRGSPMRAHGPSPVMPLLTILCLVFACLCHANDWDYQRGKYLPDAQINELRGPVQSLTTYSYTNGTIQSSTASEFDRKGNLVRSVSIDASANCYANTYTYDGNGTRLTDSLSVGKPEAGHVACHDVELLSATAFRPVFNAKGLPTSLTTTVRYPDPNPLVVEVTTRYTYDSASRPIKIDFTSGDAVNFYAYSYFSDLRGVHIKKHSYRKSGQAVLDVVTDLIYAADGRLLELTNTPADVIGFGGSATEVYDDAGRLIQEKRSDDNTIYGQHDKFGNWTEMHDNFRREVRILTYY